MSENQDIKTSPQRAFTIMKIAAILLLAVIFAILTLHSKHEDSTIVTKLRKDRLDLRPVSDRIVAENIKLGVDGDHTTILTSIAEYHGQILHINFWASWCEPCLRELPEIERLTKEFQDDYVPILINLDDDAENQIAAKKIQLELAPSVIALYDGDINRTDTKALALKMNAEVIPYHVIIDKTGKVAAEFYASLDKEMAKFRNILRKLMAEQ